MSILGIDVGTSSTKCTLFDTNGNIIFETQRKYELTYLNAGECEINPYIVWNHVKEMIIECNNESRIIGMAVSSFGETAVYIDSNDDIVRNSFLYTDKRGDIELQYILNRLNKDEIKRVTGLYPNKMYSIVKLLWLKNNEYENYKKIDKVFQFTDYISYMLTNKRTIDYGLASRTMAFDINEKMWSQTIFDAVGISKELFSNPKPVGHFVGNVISIEEIDSDCKVYIGSQDQVSAFVGSNPKSTNVATLGLGSVACIIPQFDNSAVDSKKYPIVPFLDKFVTYAFHFNSGSLIKWYLSKILDVQSDNIFDKLEKNIKTTPTGVLLLPHFSGSGTPHMDSDSKSVFYGLSLESDRYQIYQSILEGIGYELRYNVEYLNMIGISFDTLNVTGGGAKSDKFCQILANILDRQINKINVIEAGTLGNFAIVATGLGLYDSFRSSLEKVVYVTKTFKPKNAYEYSIMYNKYKSIYDISKKIDNRGDDK